ncbi:ribosome assembly RNA-binding protein YhbY [Carnobacteriaceae bacterium zg-ZUI252]|nr:ribosome assembly RNA-binding protein YhbY [Carnobacteriaceae bacterium zg-ZUI252]
MLSKKQVQFLKKEAHHLKPIFQVGKNGMNDDLIRQIFEAIDKRELIKVTLLQNTLEDTQTVKEQLLENLPIEVVQIIGHTLVLYKKASKEKYQVITEKMKNLK